MELFKTHCTTCHAKLRVHDPAVVGEIVACPKCNSMVLIDPPPNWAPPKVISDASSSAPVVAVTSDSSGTLPGGSAPELDEASSTTARSTPVVDAKKDAEAPAPTSRHVANADDVADPVDAESNASLPDDGAIDMLSADRFGQKLTLAMMVPAALLLLFTIYWTVSSVSRPSPAESLTTTTDATVPEMDNAPPDADELEGDKVIPSLLDPLWMPEGAAYALGCGPSFLRSTEALQVVTESHLPGLWKDIQSLLEDLAAEGVAVHSLQWAGLTAGRWKDDCVVVLHLAEMSDDVASWFATGKQVDLSVAGVNGRRFDGQRWSHPMALIDARTLVTGAPNMLATPRLGEEQSTIAAGLAELLLEEPGDQSSSTVSYRFVSERPANRDTGFTWLPDWIAKQSSATAACQTLRTVPRVVDEWMDEQELPTWNIRLHCKNEADAVSVDQACKRVFMGLNQRWSAETAGLDKQLKAGRLTAEAADQVRAFLGQALATLEAATATRDGSNVLVSLQWPDSMNDVARAIVDSRTSRLQFNELMIVAGDLSHHQMILNALTATVKSEGRWPMGAAGAAQLRAETRLSWIASVLPYLEGGDVYRDLHRQLNFFRPWNDPANLDVVRKPLNPLTNPRLGATVTAAGFPTTHYVGVAGLGTDAALLDPADPRAGVFNFRHRISLEDMKDGASQTVAVLGVTGRLGPWAAGGDATVRPLTAQPYMNGPDHFGSGMAKGMFAGMADGSVRFLAADIDPHVLEQLVTINSGPIDRSNLEQTLTSAESLPHGDASPEDASTVPTELPSAETHEPTAKIEFDKDTVDANGRIVALLATRLAAIDFADVTLNNFVEFVAQLTAVKITFDRDAMSDVGVGTDDTLSVRLAGATYAEVLDVALMPLGLGFIVRQGELIVTTLARQAGLQRAATYPIAELCGEEPSSCEALTAVIRALVAPNTWATVGGTGRLLVEDGLLVAETNDLVHRRLAEFLEKLRLARGSEGDDDAGGAGVSLLSRTSQAFEILQTPVALDFDKPTPLAEILARLQETAGVNLLLDIPALAAAGITPGVETSLKVAGVTLEQALDRVCSSLELTHRVKDDQTIQITTITAAAGRLELEFYPVDAQLEGDTSADALIARIQASIAPQSWTPNGGPAAILFDKSANCLIVRQTQPQQTRIEALLNNGPPRQAQPEEP